MRSGHVFDLADCTEFRQTILSRPPRILHGWVWMLVALIGAAMLWSFLTTADQIVKARGRVRPVGNPHISSTQVSGIFVSACTDGRVNEVLCQRGDKVQAGDILARINTVRLDQEIDETSLRIKELKSLLQRKLAIIFKSQLESTDELEHQIAEIESEIRSQLQHLDNLRNNRQQWAEVRAPVSGIVTTVDVHSGEYVSTKDPIAAVAVENGHEFYTKVLNKDVGELKIGMPVRVKLDAYNYHKFGTLAGRVKSISRDAELVTGDSIDYNVVIQFESEELGRGPNRGRVGLGMEGTAEIIIGRERLLTLATRGVREKTSVR